MSNSFIERLITGSGCIARKGEYLIDNATPMFCVEVLMRNIANNIENLTESYRDETADEAAARFKLARDYMKVLEFLMAQMQDEVMPAIGRLHKLQFPEETEDKP